MGNHKRDLDWRDDDSNDWYEEDRPTRRYVYLVQRCLPDEYDGLSPEHGVALIAFTTWERAEQYVRLHATPDVPLGIVAVEVSRDD